MQGVIAMCLEQMVQEEFGRKRWDEILEASGLPYGTSFAGRAEVADDIVVVVVKSTSEVLDLSPVQVADRFKDFWVRVFAPRLYTVYYSSANEMLRSRRQPAGDEQGVVLH